MNIGIIGAGAIAHFLLDEINMKQHENFNVTNVFVRNKEKYKQLEQTYGIKLHTQLNTFLQSNIDIVVEAATIEAVEKFVPSVLKVKPVVLISVGALANELFVKELTELTEQYKNTLYLPSGAVGGLDLLQNAHALGTVKAVSLTTRKPANSLIEATLTDEKVIFEGSAAEAIQQYPKNMNVSIVLALASIGFVKTKVTLVADPHVTQNIHEIKVEGDFGEATLTIKNNPLPQNPKTSYLAAMSILGTLQRIQRRIVIGG